MIELNALGLYLMGIITGILSMLLVLFLVVLLLGEEKS